MASVAKYGVASVARGRRQEAGSRRQEAGGRRLLGGLDAGAQDEGRSLSGSGRGLCSSLLSQALGYKGHNASVPDGNTTCNNKWGEKGQYWPPIWSESDVSGLSVNSCSTRDEIRLVPSQIEMTLIPCSHTRLDG